MSDNQRYYDIFNNAVQYFEHEGSKDPDQDALDAVVAAVRGANVGIANRAWQSGYNTGRRSAARDIRATGWPACNSYARIAEGEEES